MCTWLRPRPIMTDSIVREGVLAVKGDYPGASIFGIVVGDQVMADNYICYNEADPASSASTSRARTGIKDYSTTPDFA